MALILCQYRIYELDKMINSGYELSIQFKRIAGMNLLNDSYLIPIKK